MPVVYACIVPSGSSTRTRAALEVVETELSNSDAGVTVLIAARKPGQAIGVGSSPDAEELADLMLRAAEAELIPTVERRGEVVVPEAIAAGIGELPRIGITTSRLQPRFHFEFGRVIGRVLSEREERAAVVCEVGLASDRAGRAFGERYRRALEAWDVKWLVGLDPETRRLAGESCVAQTAVLMGALSWCRIQPRVLHYDENAGVLVATIDVLGRRGKGAGRSE
jgi:hypothetical protein